MIMFKVTNTGIYEKLVLKVRGKAVFYLLENKFDGTIKTQKELLYTRFHDWVETREIADTVYRHRTGRIFQ